MGSEQGISFMAKNKSTPVRGIMEGHPFPSLCLYLYLDIYHVMWCRSQLQPHIYDVTFRDNEETCF